MSIAVLIQVEYAEIHNVNNELSVACVCVCVCVCVRVCMPAAVPIDLCI